MRERKREEKEKENSLSRTSPIRFLSPFDFEMNECQHFFTIETYSNILSFFLIEERKKND